MDIYYFTLTGQTKRFIKKLDLDAQEITPEDPFISVTKPFVLVIPTYETTLLEPVFDFLDYEQNAKFLKGIAGSGNRNFGDLFLFSPKEIAETYEVPLLFAFEFSGTPLDIKNFRNVVLHLES